MQNFHLNREDGLHLEYHPRFFTRLFPDVYRDMPFEPIQFLPHSRCYPLPAKQRPRRTVCAFSDTPGYTYRYGGQYVVAQHPWLPVVAEMKRAVCDQLGEPFNFALVNYYPDGGSYISPHQDNEEDFVEKSPIACLTFGFARDVAFQQVAGPGRYRFAPVHGSLYVMHPPTNQLWTHAVPKQQRIHLPRISVTFRVFR